jgi:hypothetical protein
MIYEGRELSKLILVYGLDTYSLKGCYSAGTMAFISGTNRFLGTGASLGFHQYHLHYEDIDKFVNLKKEQEKDLRIFKRKGIKKEFLEKLYATSSEDLWFPSRDELLSAGVIHGVVNPSDLTPLEHMEDINVKEMLLDMPVYRTMQKYEPEVFEQIITDSNEQLKNGATLIELQETGANHSMILANRLLPMSSDETLIRFGQISVGLFRNLVEIDPILCLKYLYPQQYGTFVFSKYISHDVTESLNEVLQNIIIDAYEKESTPIDTEAVELQMQKLVLQHKDDVEYIVIGHEKLQNSDQYKRYCDALIRFYELILAEDKRIAANMLRYIFAQAAADVAMCSDFEWSDNPGAYEAHLVRRCNNPYFPAHLQAVSEEELLEARAIDNNDYLLAEEQFAQLVKSIEAMDSFNTVEETNKLRERIDDLISFSIGVGGRANQIAKAADTVREALIAAMREAVSNDQNALETIEEADELHKQYTRIYYIPVIAQMTRERSPIRKEDVVATILSENPETIAIAMSLQSEDIRQQFRQVAVEMMEKARNQGYVDNYFEEKLSALVAVSETIVSKQDAEYIVKGVDIDTGELKPDIPQNETQSVLSNMMKEYNQLNMDTNDKISNIGAFEFATFTELKIKDDVLQLKNNLRKYIDIRTAYYNSMDNLLKKYRGELNYGSKQDERLSGTAAQFMEKLEVKYVNDLNEFYEFILSHHEKMNFAEDQIYLEDQALVNNLNTLFEKAVKSSTELTSAQEIGKKTMGDSVKEWQNEINAK